MMDQTYLAHNQANLALLDLIFREIKLKLANLDVNTQTCQSHVERLIERYI
jgi:hypothetical protein